MRSKVERKLSYILKRYGRGFLVLALLTGLLVSAAVVKEAEALRVTVKRVVFEGPVRSEIITIINSTNEEKIYRLGWRPMRMTEDQALVYLEDQDPASVPGLMPADDLVRFAPRRVVLAPGSSQKVRLMVRRPRDLPAGEYRSHFWIQPEAPPREFGEQPEVDRPVVELTMLTGLTMPVIVRSGQLSATARISDFAAAIKDGRLHVSMTLHRDGDRSVFGDMKFFCDGELFRETRGIAVYTEVNKRNLTFDYAMEEGGPQSCGNVSVQYVAPEDDLQFRGGVMAEASARL